MQEIGAPGKLVQGIASGVEIAQRAEKVTGVPTMLLAPVTGGWGSLAWISGYESIEALEAAQATLFADGDTLAFFDQVTESSYMPHAQQSMYRRIG